MSPIRKMNELQRRVDVVNRRVVKRRERLMKSMGRQMGISVLILTGGSIVFLIMAEVVYLVYHLRLRAAPCTAIADLLLLSAGVMKNKKSKSWGRHDFHYN